MREIKMREIKFRAWGTYHNSSLAPCMHYWDIMEFDDNQHWLFATEGWAIMQYTGLKDKNGFEIYEGDIVRQLLEPEKTFRRDEFEVKWNGLRCMPFEIFEDYKYFGGNKFEIIGNIYENPELLNDK